jgi:predicted esterase
MKRYQHTAFFSLLILHALFPNLTRAQTIHTSLPAKINPTAKYLFYLHGRFIEEEGPRAISKEYGAYEYYAILDTLKDYGFTVISEVRAKNTDVNAYAVKTAAQIDTLLKAGVPPQHIFVVGASKGAFIALFTSIEARNDKVNFLLMGMCNKEDNLQLANAGILPCGNFLSIYEASDPYSGSCELWNDYDCISGFQEVKINMNNKHGFLYKAYPQWVKPLMAWAIAIK